MQVLYITKWFLHGKEDDSVSFSGEKYAQFGKKNAL